MRPFSILFLSFFIGMYSSFAQSLQYVVQQHYPHAGEPGGIAFAALNGKIELFAFGKGDLSKNIAIGGETSFRMASVSKQFTAMATYLLIKQGILSFETPIREILTELPEVTQPITIDDLIQHTSGIWDYEEVIPKGQQKQLSDTDVLHLVSGVDSVHFPAGSRFRYSNTGYCLLAVIVERVSKMDYPTFAAKHIFKPAGLAKALVYNPDRIIPFRAYGYHPITSGFQFADQSLTSATKGDGGVYISAQEFLLWMNNANPLWDNDFWNTLKTHKVLVGDDIYYSMGWFLKKDGEGGIQAIFHSGESTGFHNAVLFLPQQNRAIGMFTNRDDRVIDDAYDAVLHLYKAKPLKTNQSLFQWLSKVYAGELQ